MEEEYKSIFNQFLKAGYREEKEDNFNPAISNYYKAITALCSYLIFKRTKNKPKNHQEIFLFLKLNFSDIYTIAKSLFAIYTGTYTQIKVREDCIKVKNAIKEIAKISGIEEEIKENLKEIQLD